MHMQVTRRGGGIAAFRSQPRRSQLVGFWHHAAAAFLPGEARYPFTGGWVWTGTENLALTGIRSPYRPARSESLPNAVTRPRLEVVPASDVVSLRVVLSKATDGCFKILYHHFQTLLDIM
jgi:hypothetical protein